MKNIRDLLTVLFRDITPEDILDKVDGTSVNHLNTPLVYKLMEQRMPQYSRNELMNLMDYLECTVAKNRSLYFENHSVENQPNLNLFSLLVYYVNQLLVVHGNKVRVRYEKLLHWKDLSFALGEDVLVASYLAHQDYKSGLEKKENSGEFPYEFTWDWDKVLEHDNREIHAILKKGMAENHCHLKGSVPLFEDTWDYLIYHFDENGRDENGKPKSDYISDETLLKDIEKESRNATFMVSPNYVTAPLLKRLSQAMKCRMWLIDYIKGASKYEDGRYGYEKLRAYKREKNYFQKVKDRNKEIRNHMKSEKEENFSQIVADMKDLMKKESPYFEVTEREFLYQCFMVLEQKRMEHQTSQKGKEKKISDCFACIFYTYLLIQNRFRVELVQINKENVGFANFSVYEERKDVLIDENINTCAKALHHILKDNRIKYLEARIAPRKTKEKYDEFIEKNETDLLKIPGMNMSELEKFRYIIHFIKGKDVPEKKETKGKESKKKKTNHPSCRHAKRRNNLLELTEELEAFRNSGSPNVNKIIGIDACNQEIGCRPEVFAPVFRRLRSSAPKNAKRLRVTYHVGEDFLDVADGLRAIYEAVHFLNLENGDRLGHAIVLGINAEEWYENKYRLLLPGQDYIDNIVWLYYALVEYKIPDTDNLKVFLRDEFKKYFRYLYMPYIEKHEVESFISNMKQKLKVASYSGIPIQNYYDNHQLDFDIQNYYYSWMLRGDDPECYKDGYYNKTQDMAVFESEKWKVNADYPKDYQIRFLPEPAILNYYYQFSEDIRREAGRCIRVEVCAEYVRAVCLVQREMEREIAKRGIAIETNPTANYLIGTFKRYDQHPIIHWYNHCLTRDPKELEECPQLNVSINTDDLGIFSTTLSNEYALMALALERVVDGNGEPKYKKNDIYRWLDEVREMGIRQNFIYQDED